MEFNPDLLESGKEKYLQNMLLYFERMANMTKNLLSEKQVVNQSVGYSLK